MKKITSLVILAILILTCVFTLTACEDKPENDKILGWYVNYKVDIKEFHLLHFYCEQSTLKVEEFIFGDVSDNKIDDIGYAKTDDSGNITKSKDKKVYKLDHDKIYHTFTLDTANEPKTITTNYNYNLFSNKWVYIASSDKTIAEAKASFDDFKAQK